MYRFSFDVKMIMAHNWFSYNHWANKMMSSLAQDVALIVIDVQKAFDDPKWGKRNNPQAEANIAKLLEAWRHSGRPVIHVQHCSREQGSPFRADSPGNAIKEIAKPIQGELVIQKNVNSAFIGTGLESHLRKQRITGLVIVGLTTDHCVSTTARMAGNLGFTTFVISDATATFDRSGPNGKKHKAADVHEVSLASLHQEFATVVDTQNLISGLKASSPHR
jgi:nicotinamidase-related amidase